MEASNTKQVLLIVLLVLLVLGLCLMTLMWGISLTPPRKTGID